MALAAGNVNWRLLYKLEPIMYCSWKNEYLYCSVQYGWPGCYRRHHDQNDESALKTEHSESGTLVGRAPERVWSAIAKGRYSHCIMEKPLYYNLRQVC